jgi:hypothetical protein
MRGGRIRRGIPPDSSGGEAGRDDEFVDGPHQGRASDMLGMLDDHGNASSPADAAGRLKRIPSGVSRLPYAGINRIRFEGLISGR